MRKKLPNGYWTKEKCAEKAALFQQKIHFERECGSAYIIALKNKWIDDICGHMKSPQKPSGFWTKDNCIKEALKYKTYSAFAKGNSAAIDAAQRQGIMHLCTSHMTSPQVSKNTWTKEACYNEALKYETISDFAKSNPYVYGLCRKNSWFDATNHMERKKSDFNVIYLWKAFSVVFENVYKIGVTSERLGTQRLEHVAKSNSIEIEKILFFEKIDNACSVEVKCLKKGKIYNQLSGDGCSEFRVLSCVDLESIKEIIQEAKSCLS